MAEPPPSTTVPAPATTTVTPPPSTPPSPSPIITTLLTTISFIISLKLRISTILHKTLSQLLNRLEILQLYLPAVILYTLWNLAFIVFSSVALILIIREKRLQIPQIRVFGAWICGSSLQRLIHVLMMFFKYQMRNRNVIIDPERLDISISFSNLFRFVRRLEKFITKFSGSLLYFGLVLMCFGRETFLDKAPLLYWLMLVFYTPDLLFAALCFLTEFFDNNTNTQKDKSHIILPTYEFEASNDGRVSRMIPMGTNDPDFSYVRVLQAEDSLCCICLCNYEDGAKLNSLLCNHHFHAACLLKWLREKARCPLCNCKFIINRIHG